jgi:hypothetical protein
MNSVQQGFYDVEYEDPIEMYCLQLEAKHLIFVAIKTGGKTNSLSGEMIFMG